MATIAATEQPDDAAPREIPLNFRGNKPHANSVNAVGSDIGATLPSQRDHFQATLLPHLDAAYNLARWLMRNEQDAQDAVQEAYLRAWKAFAAFKGDGARGWLLAIVRNVCLTLLRRDRRMASLDETTVQIASDIAGPDLKLLQSADAQMLREAIDSLPVEFREVIVLRELQSLSYKEVASVAGIPIGTVMSRLSRARQLLQEMLVAGTAPEGVA